MLPTPHMSNTVCAETSADDKMKAGDAALAAGDYDLALKSYSEAISIDNQNYQYVTCFNNFIASYCTLE